ncbi:ABC transporter permease [Ignavibacterium sp.]|uniref:ABC transporter permease n=1 Tax=Ignavibacterium sp. TaxID=2651167 RepID=UPI0021FCE8DC|nr:ABC transporter permease [Ignavibacterium sp.]BDQ03168.1 MAG: transport permease protein [Ignavibacterium sp.]
MNIINKFLNSLYFIAAVSKKEVRQLKRDFRLLFVIFFFPVFLLVIFGYAINFDVRHIKLAVYDQEKSDLSRELVNSLKNSEYFDVVAYLNSIQESDKILDVKAAQCVLVIPDDFSRKIFSRQDVTLQFLIDGVDGNTASIIKNYVSMATFEMSNNISQQVYSRLGINTQQPIAVEPIFWYNPSLQTTRFLVPGLISMILLITSVISISLTLVREKERGTQEQLNVSQLNSLELLIGKIIPYLIIAFVNAAFILLASYILFGVEVKGSFLELFLTTLLFLFSSASLGIFISVISDSQQIAFTLGTFISLLPSVILSGFIFPIDNMPFAVQILTNITPAKFFIVILRNIMLKGVSVESYFMQIIYLLIFALIPLTLGTIISRKKMESI